MISLAISIAFTLLLSLQNLAFADETVTLGVLAFRPKPETLDRWQPTADYLSAKTGKRFRLEALDYPELEDEIKAQKLDFVLTNPAHYVLMTKRNGLSSPLATLINAEDGQALAKFGGVVIVRAGRTDIANLIDLRGKTIATPDVGSLGGFLMQAYELSKAGLEIPDDIRILQTGMPHDRVIDAVLGGQADAGFIRTGVMEPLQKEAKLEPVRLKILNPQAVNGFPFLLSTPLYPEWPFAAMPQVDEELARRVTAALYSMPADHPAAIRGGYRGWSIPSDYEPVRAMLQTLRQPPFDTAPAFTMKDILDKHWISIAIGSTSIVIIVVLLVLLVKRQRALWLHEQHVAELRDKLLSALGEGVYGVNTAGNCTFINPAALTMLGYGADELMGQNQHALFHHHYPDGRPYPINHCPIYLTLQDGKTRHVEEVFFRKDGEPITVGMTVTPMERKGLLIGAVVVFRDIGERKRMEAELHAMATTDPLTGLPNRRYFLSRLDQEAARLQRFDDTECALLMLDLDHFKQVNDSHGHAAGDRILTHFAEVIRTSLRKTDFAGRLGGEEFAILLMGTTPEDAAEFADRLRKRVKDETISHDGTRIRITVSIGVTPLLPQDTSIDITLARADAALYRAKAGGRNRIELDSGIFPETSGNMPDAEHA